MRWLTIGGLATTVVAGLCWSAAATPPRGALLAAGVETEYTPVLGFEVARMKLVGGLRFDACGALVSPVTLDRYGARRPSEPTVDTQLTLGLRFDSQRELQPARLVIDFAFDAISGTVTEAPSIDGDALAPGTDDGQGYPGADGWHGTVRTASLQLDIAHYLHLYAGFMESHWGLGLLANDGRHGWEPGTARFADPRGGDVVLRGMIATGPYTDARILVATAFDSVWRDDTLLDGDEALQAVGAIRLGLGLDYSGGIYGAYRMIESAGGSHTEVGVLDLAGSARFEIDDANALVVEAEGALVFGQTTLGPTFEHRRHDILQAAAALRATWDASSYGAVLDFLVASGDDNPHDRIQGAFKVDRNYEQGLLLHRYVFASQSARATATASDPDLMAVPPDDLERFATRGAISNTLSLFPRLFYRPIDGLEIYGGALVAFTVVDSADPLSSSLAGGYARNALGGRPAPYLGTEVDLGLRFRTLLWGSELTLGVEGGVLVPGAGFRDASGVTMDLVYGGRVMVGYRL